MPAVINTGIDETLSMMLGELKDEFLRTIDLTNRIRSGQLDHDRFEEILGELTASVTHLQAQSEIVKNVIQD